MSQPDLSWMPTPLFVIDICRAALEATDIWRHTSLPLAFLDDAMETLDEALRPLRESCLTMPAEDTPARRNDP